MTEIYSPNNLQKSVTIHQITKNCTTIKPTKS